jgi:hypothetical protein
MTALTDADIAKLKAMPKTLLNPRAREKQHNQFLVRDFEIEGPNGEKFFVYTRQNTLDPEDFSTGLRWTRGGMDITLARYNGSNHRHRNAIENETIEFQCHIHELTERYQLAGLRGESYAVPTTAYSDLAGALKLLYSHWNISPPPPKVPSHTAQMGLL